MWIQLRTCKQVVVKGKRVNCQPGDWVNIGKQTAQRWLTNRDAQVAKYRLGEFLPEDGGVVVKRLTPEIAKLVGELDVHVGEPELRYHKTLCWDPSAPLTEELIMTGMGLLGTWQAAVPLQRYDRLAIFQDDGKTKEVIHDLRVPLYDTRAMFLRRCPETRDLLRIWKEEGGDDMAFLRALYQSKPLMLALPNTWTSKE